MKRYLEAFSYPLRGGNAMIMIVGVAVLSILPVLWSILPFTLGDWSYGLGILFIGYYALYLRSILSSSMEGSEHLPPWPDLEHPENTVQDILSILLPFLVSFLPLILVLVFRAELGAGPAVNAGLVLACIPLFLFGWLYLPMAVLVWTYYGGWGILNPIAVARSAWQTGPSYLVLSLLTAVMVGAAGTIRFLTNGILTGFGASLLTFYALVVSMRMLGTHYNIHRETLGWETTRISDPH